VATTIPFTRGAPSPDLLPVDDLRQAAADALERDPGGALAYTPGGYRPLREWIAERHGVPAERVLLSNGSLEALNFLVRHLFGEGGRAIVEDPTYDRTLTVLRTFGAVAEGVPVRPDGLDLDALEALLGDGERPRLVYTIPTFQNPSGATLTRAGRERLVELAREHDLLVVEDDPYGLLRFEGEAAPSLHELDGGEHVVYSSSFTKTVAPGVRTGYMVLPEALVGPLAAISERTCIGPNTFAEAALAAYCRAGRFEPNVERATAMLRERRDAMDEGLRRAFPDGTAWTAPQGGYFFWVELPAGLDTGELLAGAAERGVPYVRGSDFRVAGGGEGALRLAFSATSPEQIAEGMDRLGALFCAAAGRAPQPVGA
jgi:DNA-binding transcriptional MocR family regulator